MHGIGNSSLWEGSFGVRLTTGWGLVASILALLVGYLVYSHRQSERSLKKSPPLPPGSFGLPFLGESLQYLAALRANDGMDFFERRRVKYGQVFKTHLVGHPVAVLDAPAGNHFLFSNENKLVQSNWPSSVATLLGQGSLAVKFGDDHRRARRVFMTFLSPEGLQSFVPRMDTTARSHLAKYWEGVKQISAAPVLKNYTFSLVADLWLSLEEGPEFDAMQENMEVFVDGIMQLPIDLPGTRYHKANRARSNVLSILDPIITRRRKDLQTGKTSAQQDLLSVLICTPDDMGHFMTDTDIKDNLLLLSFAGHDTSSVTLAVVLKYLALNPHCLEELIQEQREISEQKGGEALNWEDTRRMKYTWRVIQESLRLQPPVQGTFRKAMKDFEYGGFTIPKGWLISWTSCCSHKYPEFFPNPEKFDPSRFEGKGPVPYTYLPFGGGPRTCLGSEFARTEMLVFLHHLVLRHQWTLIDPHEKISVDPMPVFHKGLPLRIGRKELAG